MFTIKMNNFTIQKKIRYIFVRLIYSFIITIFYCMPINADIVQKLQKKSEIYVLFSSKDKLSKELLPCVGLSYKTDKTDICKQNGVFISIPSKYEYRNFHILAYININSGYRDEDISIHLQKKDGLYSKSSLFLSKESKIYLKNDKNISKTRIKKMRSFRLIDLFPKLPKDGLYDLYFTYKGKKSNTVTIDISILEFYRKEPLYDKNGNIDNSPILNLISTSKLISYQNGCDFKNLSGVRRNKCYFNPIIGNKRISIRKLGVFINIPKTYSSFDFSIFAKINVDYNYKDDDIVLYLKSKDGSFNESKVFYTVNKISGDYRDITKFKDGKVYLYQKKRKYLNREIQKLFAKPLSSGVYDFYFTFRGEKSNTIQINLEL